jgi:hypothetical protein
MVIVVGFRVVDLWISPETPSGPCLIEPANDLDVFLQYRPGSISRCPGAGQEISAFRESRRDGRGTTGAAARSPPGLGPGSGRAATSGERPRGAAPLT